MQQLYYPLLSCVAKISRTTTHSGVLICTDSTVSVFLISYDTALFVCQNA